MKTHLNTQNEDVITQGVIATAIGYEVCAIAYRSLAIGVTREAFLNLMTNAWNEAEEFRDGLNDALRPPKKAKKAKRRRRKP